jgi:CubicO group peptidase (beta-lactamase class C family)
MIKPRHPALLAASMLVLTPLALAREPWRPTTDPSTREPTTTAPASAAPTSTARPTTAPARAAWAAAAEYSARHAGHAVLVMHDGEVVFERYDNAWSASRPHMLASGTKSFTGVVAMFAVQDGLLTLDELASDTLTEWRDDPRKSRITIRQLLTLSSGLDPSDALFRGRGANPDRMPEVARERYKRLERQGKADNHDWFAAAINVPAIHDPGEKFDYGAAHFYAFGALLDRKLVARKRAGSDVGVSRFEEYVRLRVADPLGMAIARWGKDEVGNVNLPGGMMLTAREWAKFGLFVLRDGAIIDGKGQRQQLLKPELLAQCFEPSKANPMYGLTWWLLDRGNAEQLAADGQAPLNARARRQIERQGLDQTPVGPDGKALKVIAAMGLGKQRLYVIPQLRLVIVRFAEASREGQPFQDAEFLRPIVESMTKQE